MRAPIALLVVVALAVVVVVASAQSPTRGVEPKIVTGHGFSMYGDLKYGRDFKHFDYVNPNATKRGDVRLAAIGTFDTLNPFILKGVAATGLGQVFDTLTTQSADEPFSEYWLIAETIEVPTDRSWVAFTLRP
jgi:microcin C transport system substrate-binding protein